ncbi:quinon protein alcohol dehydrogenase-like superfamily [Mycena albidolilacea]|uniref:Quinon protein alcohol dehydrogenase-like superfamily n=1 Tax=Mycena albidolilacea TaxID=1033008 RepID=A0AAD6ZVS2_9AGAR|nr:quinon protein alcohol dehydrogenase-like superfamily [Mycena albidolilacea]
MTCISSTDFSASWKHSLSADFQQNGVAAGSEPWVSEVTKFAVNGETRVVVLSADGSTLAAGVGDEIHVYDTATSQLLHTLHGHAGHTVENLEFHPRGRRLAAGSTRHSSRTLEALVRVWDLDTPSQSPDYLDDAAREAVTAASSILLQRWSTEDLESADLQPQIAQILSVAQAAVDVRNGRVLPGNLPSFGARVFSHDGRSLLYLPDRQNVTVVDVATLTERFQLSGHTDAIMWAETSPGDKVVATSSWDRTVRIWSMESGESLRVLKGAANQSWAGAFSPDGELIAAGSGDRKVRIWGVDTGELLYTFSGFGDWIRSLAFSPDGLQLAAGSADGSLRMFDLKSGDCAQSWQIDAKKDRSARSFLEIVGVQYTSRGDLFFCSSDGRVFGYRPSQNLKWEFLRPHLVNGVWFKTFAVSKDGSKLISALCSNVGIWKID